jgi:hypothetical protein
MTDRDTSVSSDEKEPGLFQKYPKLGVIIVALVAYVLLISMCLVVVVLIVRG